MSRGEDGHARPGPSPGLSVVVPTYNERERLEEFVGTVLDVLSHSGMTGEIVIVDDRSPDGTGELADRLSAHYPLRVVHRPGKLGLGSAVVTGCSVARGEALAVMDADLSHPPAVLPSLVAALDGTGADMAIASRYIPGGGTRNWPMSRAVMSRAACLLARVLTPVRDAASGFFVMRRCVLQDVQIEAAGFKICLELLVRGNCRAVAEVPYVFVDRAAGQSKMNHREATGYLLQVLELSRWARRNRPGLKVTHIVLTEEDRWRLAAAHRREAASGGDTRALPS
ncbi:MAG: polyprenol monophosphomannose synthase [Acidobacteriota bacterium]